MGLIILMQNISHELGAIVPTPHHDRHGRRDVFAGREPPLLQLIAGIMEFNNDILDDIPPVALEPRPEREVLRITRRVS